MNLSKGLTNLVHRVKEAINPTPQLPEWMQPDARTPRWADDEKRTREDSKPKKHGLIPEGYQDSTGFHHGPVPKHKQGSPDIE